MSKKKHISLYIHIPFCKVRCGYCDFNTYAGMETWIPRYLDALKAEIAYFANHLQNDHYIHTIYFGGGTPSVIPAKLIADVLGLIRNQFDTDEKAEVTFEANPNGLTQSYFMDICEAGINRVSIGMQSSVATELEILDRQHSQTDVERCIEFVQRAGIANVNLDLIYGIPTQTMVTLKESVKAAAALKPNHLSVYGLILHEETALFRKVAYSEIASIDEDLEADMYIWLMTNLSEMGYQQYEISNWVREKGDQSKHNLQYWRNLEYLGVGAGAHSHIGHFRWQNTLKIHTYIDAIQSIQAEQFLHSGCEDVTQLSAEDDLKETMMMGLRLTEAGVSVQSLHARFGVDIRDSYSKEIEKLSASRLIELVKIDGEDVLRLTERGRLLGNQVFMAFI